MPSSVLRRSGDHGGMDIEKTLRIMGVKWMRKVRTYGVAGMVKTLKEAMRSAERGDQQGDGTRRTHAATCSLDLPL
jgi:indolepyruvate ferredoxin oxidoreductase alpha subunit